MIIFFHLFAKSWVKYALTDSITKERVFYQNPRSHSVRSDLFPKKSSLIGEESFFGNKPQVMDKDKVILEKINQTQIWPKKTRKCFVFWPLFFVSKSLFQKILWFLKPDLSILGFSKFWIKWSFSWVLPIFWKMVCKRYIE